jgi:hypothetical protein
MCTNVICVFAGAAFVIAASHLTFAQNVLPYPVWIYSIVFIILAFSNIIVDYTFRFKVDELCYLSQYTDRILHIIDSKYGIHQFL